MKRKLLEGQKPEWSALLLFSALYIVVTAFHEPWFDEAQAWQIAKCASVREILFEVPHYEGHPALWTLILAIPAKLGVPFEFGLKSVGLGFSILSVWLILFRMPYPRLMRLILPFTYFVFYQYGVIVRPYVMMQLAFLLLALEFPKRYRDPWKFVGILVFLCLTSAYGLVMAGGIALCMVYELIREKGIRRFFVELFADRRTLALGGLLAAAILIVLEIMPRSDTWVTSAVKTNSLPLCLCCAFLTFMGECTLTTSTWFRQDRVLLQNANINGVELAAFCFIGVFLWVLVVNASSKKALKYYLVPYTLFSVFASLVYFGVHHVGVIFLLLLFWLGILFQDENRFEIGRSFVKRIAQTSRDKILIKRTAIAACFVCLIVPLYWSIAAAVNEVRWEYSYGRSGAEYIIEHDLDNGLILSEWLESNPEKTSQELIQYKNTYAVGYPVLLNAYFDHNICLNLNEGRDDEAYMHYKLPTEEEKKEALIRWRSAGIPEVILGKPDLELLYNEEVSSRDYSLAAVFQIHYIWKTSISGGYIPVYVRNDIMKEHGIEPYEDEGMKYLIEGLPITDEMAEQIRSGVPAEEVLKPYLDAIFGEEK